MSLYCRIQRHQVSAYIYKHVIKWLTLGICEENGHNVLLSKNLQTAGKSHRFLWRIILSLYQLVKKMSWTHRHFMFSMLNFEFWNDSCKNNVNLERAMEVVSAKSAQRPHLWEIPQVELILIFSFHCVWKVIIKHYYILISHPLLSERKQINVFPKMLNQSFNILHQGSDLVTPCSIHLSIH